MLFIFRKLRKSFFLPGKARTYLAYAVGEIALIVVGILIAVEIGDRNQARKDREEETKILERLKSDMQSNQQIVENLLDHYQGHSDKMLALTEIIKPELDIHPEELLFGYITGLNRGYVIAFEESAVNSLISTGEIMLIMNEELRQLLINWPRSISHASKIRDQMIEELERFPSIYKYVQKMDLNSVSSRNFIENRSSDFPFNQKAFLSSPEIESMAEVKRGLSDAIVRNLNRISSDQQSTLDLIDAELTERGAEP